METWHELRGRGRAVACGFIAGGLSALGFFALCSAEAVAAAKLDPSFGVAGRVVVSDARLHPAIEMAMDEDESPVVLSGFTDETDGSACSGFGVSRFDSSGVPDPSFGVGGLVVSDSECEPRHTLAALPGGSFVLAGPQRYGSACLEATKLLSDGSVFEGWNQGGNNGASRFCYAPAAGPAGVTALASEADDKGRVLIAGSAQWGRKHLFGTVRRIRPNGTTDSSFRGTGKGWAGEPGLVRLFETGPRHYNVVNAVTTLASGKILAGGTNRGGFAIARLNPKGSADESFGSASGVARIDPDGRKCEAEGFAGSPCVASTAQDMIVDRHRRVIIAGNTSRFSAAGAVLGSRLSVTRLKPDGKRDRTFGKNAIAKPPVGPFSASSMAIQRDGRVLVGGESNGKPLVVRLGHDGSLDRSFFGDGKLSVAELGSSATGIRDTLVDSHGRILVLAAVQSGGFELFRLLPR